MADQNQGVDLNALHDAILNAIKKNFSQFKTVVDYPMDWKPEAVPACYIELEEMEPLTDSDPGTGQQAFMTRWCARIVMGFREPKVKRALRILAGQMAAFIHLKNWGQPGNACIVRGCYPDAFEPELDQFEVWRIEWEQELHFGTSVYAPQPSDPPQPVGAFADMVAPSVTPGGASGDPADDYTQIYPDQP